MRLWSVFIFFVFCLLSTECVDRKKFRTCEQTSFCKRNRALVSNPSFIPQNYVFLRETVVFDKDKSTIVVDIFNSRHPLQDPLECKISFLRNGIVRMAVREKHPLHPRYEIYDVINLDALKPLPSSQLSLTQKDDALVVQYSLQHSQTQYQLKLNYSPLLVSLSINGEETILFNSQNAFHFEQYRQKNPRPSPHVEGAGASPAETAEPLPHLMKYPYDVDGMWEESFGGHTDSKPHGPSAVASDISFVGGSHVYGIPEHASSFALKTTTGRGSNSYSEPYRLFNLDVFEYEIDTPMALYGAVPLLIHHHYNPQTNISKTVGVLWLNSAETFIDIDEPKEKNGAIHRDCQWISEAGIMDVYFVVGPTTSMFYAQLSDLVYPPALPPYFSIAYHQCRWNYKNEEDVSSVDSGFDAHDIPYDVLWLDIEHTDGKKYFTWDSVSFPNPRAMQNKLAEKGRKMVTIVDPHMKRDSGYKLHDSFQSNDYYIKNSQSKSESVYEGWCWPGSVSYPDFVLPDVRNFWAMKFSLHEYEGSTQHLHIWNDMNEPSVFNGPEVTMPKDCVHYHGTIEHREVHNLYGYYVHMATEEGLRRRNPNERPFVLSRSFFVGSQRWGAIWTGDNDAKWNHLEASIPMVLSLNSGLITFSGADIGGFFNDPEIELLVRWYQAAAYQPFFRAHAHIDTKRREPWLFGEPYTTYIRQTIRGRYALLPYLYTVFYEASVTGMPIARALWMEQQFAHDVHTFSLEDEYLLGPALLIKPITRAGIKTTSVYLPANSVWYELSSDIAHSTGPNGLTLENVVAPIDRIPVFQRGGTIVTRRLRPRRNSALMSFDPFTLVIALNQAGTATGMLYLDDGHSFDNKKGAYILRSFTFQPASSPHLYRFSSTNARSGNSGYHTTCTVERIVILGIPVRISSISLESNSSPSCSSSLSSSLTNTPLTFEQSISPPKLIIRKPDACIAHDFAISFS